MKRTHIFSTFVFSVFGIVAMAMQVFASDSNKSSPTSSLGSLIGVLIVWYICSSRRKKEIGGWLLYFYIQLYVGVIVTVAIGLFSFRNYIPSTWATNPSLYPLFLLSTLPTLMLLPVQL